MAVVADLILNVGTLLFTAEEGTILGKVATLVKYCIFLGIPFIGWGIVEIFFCIVKNPLVFAGLWFLLTILGIIAEYFNNSGSRSQPQLLQTSQVRGRITSAGQNHPQQQQQQTQQHPQRPPRRTGLPPIIDFVYKRTEPCNNNNNNNHDNSSNIDFPRSLYMDEEQIEINEDDITIPDIGTETDRISEIRSSLITTPGAAAKKKGKPSSTTKTSSSSSTTRTPPTKGSVAGHSERYPKSKIQVIREPFEPDVGTQTHRVPEFKDGKITNCQSQKDKEINMISTKGSTSISNNNPPIIRKSKANYEYKVKDSSLIPFPVEKNDPIKSSKSISTNRTEKVSFPVKDVDVEGKITIPTATAMELSEFQQQQKSKPNTIKNSSTRNNVDGYATEGTLLCNSMGDTNDFIMVADTDSEEDDNVRSELFFLDELKDELDKPDLQRIHSNSSSNAAANYTIIN